MVSRIDFFMPPHSQYGVLHHMTTKLFEAMTRQGIECRLLTAERNNPKEFLEQLFSRPPQFTLSFNGLLPDEQGRFFSDMLKIPHIAFLVDAPNHFIPITQSNYTIITNVDRFGSEFFKGLNPSIQSFFIPHGVEKDLFSLPLNQSRPFDIVYLGSAIDYEKIQSEWPQKWGKAVADVLNKSAELALDDPEVSFIQAFVTTLDQALSEGGAINPQAIDFEALLDDLEMYIRGKDRVDLLNEISHPVHIIGSGSDIWRKLLRKDHPHILHTAVPYEEALNIMRQTKILLNSCAWIKNGTHERILAGIACGCVVLTAKNIYMSENFSHEKDILFYEHGDLSKVNSLIQKYLKSEELANELANKGRLNVEVNHTWDSRAKTLIQILKPLASEFSSK